jgi:hypothetical protein
MLIHDADITGSFLYNGVNISNVTGSAASLTALNQFSASINLFTGSYNTGSFTGSFIGNGSGLNGVVSASFASNARSASFALTATSASQATNSNTATSSSFASTATSASQASNANTATSASQAANAVTSSYAANADLLDGIDSTRFAVTSSNTFTGTQYISAANNATSFTSTASIYTDGGFRVTKDAYVSGTIFVNNLTVYGTQSINYITSSQLNIGTNIITVNTDVPAIRFGGLAVYDSGSTRLTGSMLWDSEDNHWIYSNPSGSSYEGGMMISGPRNSSGLGNEQGTLNNVVMKGQGGDHITSSMITETGTATTFYTNALYVSSSNFVGIGTTTPTAGRLQVNSSDTTTAGFFQLNDGTTTLANSFTTVHRNANDGNGRFSLTRWQVQNASGLDQSAFIGAQAVTGASNYNPNLILGISTGASAYTTYLTIASTGAATFASSITATGNAATNSAVILNNTTGASGTAQYYADFTAGATVLGRILRGNGASGYEANGLNIDNYSGMQIKLNALGGSGGTFAVTGGAATFSSSVIAFGTSTFLGQFGNGNNVNEKIIQFVRASSTSIVNIQGINAGVGAGDIALQASGNNVGIGTTTVSSILDIRQDNLPRITLVKNGIISWYIGNPAQSTSNNFSIGTDSGGNTNILTIANTGAATFSSSVLANSFNIAANGTISSNGFWGTLHTKGAGSYSDWSVINSAGNGVMWNPTGTLGISIGGHLGVKAIPNSWTADYAIVQLAGAGAVSSTTGGATFTHLTNGTYFDGTNWKYNYTSVGVARYTLTDSGGGTHQWFLAPTGTAGNNITWTPAMRLTSSGNLLINSTSDNGEKLQVTGITRTTEAFRQDTGSVSIATNTATTIYSLGGIRGLYIIYVTLPAGDASPSNYSSYAIIAWDTGRGRILQQTDGSNLFITLSGDNNVQARQTSGNTNSVAYRLIKIG